MGLVGIALILLFGSLAYGQGIQNPESMGDLSGILPVVLNAFKSGEYLLAGAGVALVATFLFRKYALPKLPVGNAVLPLIASSVGLIAGVSLAIVNKGTLSEATFAVLSGPLGIAVYDSLLKYFFKKQV